MVTSSGVFIQLGIQRIWQFIAIALLCMVSNHKVKNKTNKQRCSLNVCVHLYISQVECHLSDFSVQWVLNYRDTIKNNNRIGKSVKCIICSRLCVPSHNPEEQRLGCQRIVWGSRRGWSSASGGSWEEVIVGDNEDERFSWRVENKKKKTSW